MKLPIYNKPGYTVGYNNDDFERDTYTVLKEFTVGDIKYLFYYSPSKTFIDIKIRKGRIAYAFKASIESLRDTKVFFEIIKFMRSDFTRLETASDNPPQSG